jgi:hypothetical protein
LRRTGCCCHALQDIYIARAEGELALEEELWGVLLVVYKTPGLLGQLTRKDKNA